MINTHMLFKTLNKKRKESNEGEIEHHLLASKLGILFALNASNYINFKGDFVEIDDEQIYMLGHIFTEHFNVSMLDELKAMSLESKTKEADQIPKEIAQMSETEKTSVSHQAGLLSKIKGFLGRKTKLAR